MSPSAVPCRSTQDRRFVVSRRCAESRDDLALTRCWRASRCDVCRTRARGPPRAVAIDARVLALALATARRTCTRGADTRVPLHCPDSATRPRPQRAMLSLSRGEEPRSLPRFFFTRRFSTPLTRPISLSATD
eukprot:Amastigsp_a339416_216.p3 type:complete len:133 gc:universal Amastigsp_a339416_216:768-1166(+)